jgi:hypothetical protein
MHVILHSFFRKSIPSHLPQSANFPSTAILKTIYFSFPFLTLNPTYTYSNFASYDLHCADVTNLSSCYFITITTYPQMTSYVDWDPPQHRKTRIVCISDTHNQTPSLPKGDVLIHAGDLTNQGSFSELQRTVTLLEKADFEAKIIIAGNNRVSISPKLPRR